MYCGSYSLTHYEKEKNNRLVVSIVIGKVLVSKQLKEKEKEYEWGQSHL